MDVKKIFENPIRSFIYMERYINDGSPSGWTHKRSTSPNTNPFSKIEGFYLYKIKDSCFDTIEIGQPDSIFFNVNYCHPDSILKNSKVLLNHLNLIEPSIIFVQPTSGGRTVFVNNKEESYFIKLTYDVNRLGRVDRQMKYAHCMSSYEVSTYIKEKIDENKFKQSFSILLESSGKVTLIPFDGGYYEWGTIKRDFKPYPCVKQKTVLVPGFSLFGKDYYSLDNEKDEFLINQFILLSNINPKNYVLDLIKMTIDAWFQTAINCALILELHCQNCYYELYEDYTIKRIVVKDMDSVVKDLTLAKKMNLKCQWESFPYECYYEDTPINHPWHYKLRPSYFYDFKLGMYLLNPVLDVVCKRFCLKKENILQDIKEYVRKNYLVQLPKDFFPLDGTWYDCDDTEKKEGESRKYYPHKDPLFR